MLPLRPLAPKSPERAHLRRVAAALLLLLVVVAVVEVWPAAASAVLPRAGGSTGWRKVWCMSISNPTRLSTAVCFRPVFDRDWCSRALSAHSSAAGTRCRGGACCCCCCCLSPRPRPRPCARVSAPSPCNLPPPAAAPVVSTWVLGSGSPQRSLTTREM